MALLRRDRSLGILAREATPGQLYQWPGFDSRDLHCFSEPKAAAYCSVWVFEDQAPHRDITYEMDPLAALKTKTKTKKRG